jgi:hypothetical protein
VLPDKPVLSFWYLATVRKSHGSVEQIITTSSSSCCSYIVDAHGFDASVSRGRIEPTFGLFGGSWSAVTSNSAYDEKSSAIVRGNGSHNRGFIFIAVPIRCHIPRGPPFDTACPWRRRCLSHSQQGATLVSDISVQPDFYCCVVIVEA